MPWISAILDQVESSEAWGFRAGTAPSAEPAALAAMALAAHGRADEGMTESESQALERRGDADLAALVGRRLGNVAHGQERADHGEE